MSIGRVHRQREATEGPCRASRPGHARGFTLVELVVTLAVLGVLVSLATPSFIRMLATNRLSTQTNELVMGLNMAKSEAIRRGQAVTLRALDDVNPNDFHRGWRAFTDSTGGASDGLPADPITASDGTVLRDMHALAGATTVRRVTRSGTSPTFTYPAATSTLSSRQFVTFNARGGTTTGGPSFFRVCDGANSAIRGRIVQVSTVGRISIDNTNENCAS